MYIITILFHINNGDIMEEIISKRLIIGRIENSIYEVATLMKDYDIGFLPIVKKDKIVGVITDRDIVIEAVSNCANTNTKIENYMTNRIISIEKDKTIDDVLQLMATYRIKRILATEGGKVIGVISFSNIITQYPNHPKLIETLQAIYTIENRPNQQDLEVDEFYL